MYEQEKDWKHSNLVLSTGGLANGMKGDDRAPELQAVTTSSWRTPKAATAPAPGAAWAEGSVSQGRRGFKKSHEKCGGRGEFQMTGELKMLAFDMRIVYSL